MFAVEVHEASAGRRGSGLAADSCGRPRSFSSPPMITKLRLAGEVPGLAADSCGRPRRFSSPPMTTKLQLAGRFRACRECSAICGARAGVPQLGVRRWRTVNSQVPALLPSSFVLEKIKLVNKVKGACSDPF